jgi:HAD superfamily hydrolase (TIGR01509 family)
MMKAAVLFDMDGVIVDTEPLKFRAYQKVFRGLGVVIEDCRERLGLSEPAVMKLYLQAHNLDADVDELIRQKRMAYHELLAKIGLTPAPGLLSLLEALREQRIAAGLVTSSDRPSTERVLEHLGLPAAFGAVLTRDDVQNPKPEPEIYLKAAGRLEVNPAQCVVIEDSPAGILAGKRAGMRTVGIISGTPAVDLLAAGADFVIPDFTVAARAQILALVPPSGRHAVEVH